MRGRRSKLRLYGPDFVRSYTMLYGAKLILKTLLGQDHVGRNFGVYPDDTFIISYPRSGSTWTRFLAANLVYPNEKVTFVNLDQLVPATAVSSRHSLKSARRPRIIKSHNYYDHRYPRVVYVVRDPRDVVLSEYRFILKAGKFADGYPMEKRESEAWVVTKGRRKDIPFVGTATAGGWKNKLPESCVAQIESAWAPLVRWLGYELVTNTAPSAGSESMLAALPASR